MYSTVEILKDPVAQSLTITSEGQVKEAKVCWQLLDESKTASPWIMDDIVLLPAVPSSIEHILQFRLNTACDLPTDKNANAKSSKDEFHIVVQYSNDQGNSWNSLHDLCLPPTCSGVQSSVIQVFDLIAIRLQVDFPDC